MEGQVAETQRPVATVTTTSLEAYNNFIMHYPEDKITAEVQRNAGTIYYNNENFDLSLRYFSTIAQRFPDSPFASQARFSVLESYFGKKDFNNAEIIAKKIQNDERLSPELRGKIKTRLAESIYLNAEALVRENKHFEAAQRFRELYVEVPDAEAFAKGSAFVGQADNPSAVYFNPAGLTQLKGKNYFSGGFAVISPSASYKDFAGNTTQMTRQNFPIPHIYLVSDFGVDNFVFGLAS